LDSGILGDDNELMIFSYKEIRESVAAALNSELDVTQFEDWRELLKWALAQAGTSKEPKPEEKEKYFLIVEHSEGMTYVY